jgi:general secretion pathway protein H
MDATASPAATGKMATSAIGIDAAAEQATVAIVFREIRIVNSSLRQAGFTLIELLVVVVIAAVIAGALTLSIGGAGGERQLAHQAEQAQALIGYACEQAELTGRNIGLSFATDGIRFSQLESADWVAIRTTELRQRSWLDGMSSKLTSDDHQVQIASAYPDKPQLVCFSSGELTPFRLELALADLPIIYRLDGQPDGDVKITTVNTRAH